jgi:nucleoside-diphosphate-sugar epimerase
MRIAVTGGTGFLGSHVVELLLESGHEVSCLVLPNEGPGWIAGKEIRFFEGSVLDRSSLSPFLEGCDAIIHLAGLTRAKTEAEFMAVNADGAANIIDAALALSSSGARAPRHIVVMSSLAAVGPSEPDGSCLDEDAPRKPLSPYGRSKAALEDVVSGYAGRIDYTIIRAPGAYGPRDRDFLQYFKLVSKGVRLIIGPRNVISLVYAKTLARAIASCVLNPAAYGQAFFIADEGAVDWDQFSELIERALGRRTFRVRVPEWFVSVVAFCSWLAKPFLRRPPLVTANKILEMRQPCWIVSTAKAERLIGFKPGMSTEDAIAETAAWYKEQGWI